MASVYKIGTGFVLALAKVVLINKGIIKVRFNHGNITSTAPFSATNPMFNQLAYSLTPTTTMLYAANHKLLLTSVVILHFLDRLLLHANY